MRTEAGHLVNAATGEVWVAGDPVAVVAGYLPFGSAAATPKEKPATRSRDYRLYSVNDTREVVWLYNNKPSMSMANIADRTGVPAATVRQWVSRYADGNSEDARYLQRPPSDGRLHKERLSQFDLEGEAA